MSQLRSVIQNPLYNTYTSLVTRMPCTLLNQVSLYDNVLVNIKDSFQNGFVTFILERGINVVCDHAGFNHSLNGIMYAMLKKLK